MPTPRADSAQFPHITPAAFATERGWLFIMLDVHDRAHVATTIERLINVLDAIDGDPDIEDAPRADSDREPWLGWGSIATGNSMAADDREADESELEPSLAAPENHPHGGWGPRDAGEWRDGSGRQTHWAAGCRTDCEHVNEDGGDVCDEPHDAEPAEPELSWRECVDQSLNETDRPVWVVDGEVDAIDAGAM